MNFLSFSDELAQIHGMQKEALVGRVGKEIGKAIATHGGELGARAGNWILKDPAHQRAIGGALAGGLHGALFGKDRKSILTHGITGAGLGYGIPARSMMD